MIPHIRLTEIILYVEDQHKSRQFYESILRQKPSLDVPGMTEFILSGQCKLGLMPNHGISKILQGKLPDPALGTGIPRCELYFYVEDVQSEFDHAMRCGAQCISSLTVRNWGDRTGYFADPDGHVLAFAERMPDPQ